MHDTRVILPPLAALAIAAALLGTCPTERPSSAVPPQRAEPSAAPSAEVVLYLRTPEGTPATNVQVAVVGARLLGEDRPRPGVVELQLAPEPRKRIQIDLTSERFRRHTIRLRPGPLRTRRTAVLQPNGRFSDLRVVDADGRPLRDVIVTADGLGAPVRTDSRGTLRLEVAALGGALTLRLGGYQDRLVPRGSIGEVVMRKKARLVVANNGRSEALVSLFDPSCDAPCEPLWSRQVGPGETRRWTLPVPADQRSRPLRVVADRPWSNSGVPGAPDQVAIAARPGATVGLALDPCTPREVSISDPLGRPLPEFRVGVEVGPEADETAARVRGPLVTDASGSFRTCLPGAFRSVAPGWALEPTAAGLTASYEGAAPRLYLYVLGSDAPASASQAIASHYDRAKQHRPCCDVLSNSQALGSCGARPVCDAALALGPRPSGLGHATPLPAEDDVSGLGLAVSPAAGANLAEADALAAQVISAARKSAPGVVVVVALVGAAAGARERLLPLLQRRDTLTDLPDAGGVR